METAVLTTLSGLSITSNITEKVIINTIQNSFSLVKRFVSFQHEQIKEVLSEHDLISKLEIIQALMNDIEEDKKSIQKQSIQKSLTNLHFVVEEIHRLMENIDNKIKYHQTKYFSSWRGLNYEDEIKKLKRYIQLMDSRYQMFLEVLKVR
jgi:hypothetical protein